MSGFCKGKAGCLMALLLAFCLGMHPIQAAENPSQTTENDERGTEISSADWMGQISGDMMLSEISMPGTHDSAAQHVFMKPVFRCQDTDISTQLMNGYRYLDIRLAIEEKDGKERLKFIHNFVDCRRSRSLFAAPLYLTDVLADIYVFLEEHPTETVIFCVKAENEDDPIEKVQQLLQAAIDGAPEYWYLQNRIPALDEVRGKVVLAVRYEDALGVGEYSRGLNFSWEDQGNKEVVDLPYVQSMINENQRLWVQDRYKYDLETKMDAVTEDFENCQASEDTFSLNFTSTAGKGWIGFPKQYAKTMNERVLSYELRPQTCYGVVIVDFGTKELARHIYETNFM